jgi:uncharacterized protein (TIGR03435 family)
MREALKDAGGFQMNRIRTSCSFAIAVLAAAAAAFGQQPAPAPGAAADATFEVASVKPSNPDPNNPLAGIALPLPLPGGRFSATNTPLRMLIAMAYELQQDAQLVGGPPALLAAKYDITAKIAGGGTLRQKDLPALLRTLLADRFKLKVHTESRELPLYDLVLARSDGRLGPDLTPSKSDCSKADEIVAEQSAGLARGDVSGAIGTPRPCTVTTDPSGGPMNLMMRGDGQEMKQIAEILSQLSGRTVRDKTGLTGRYDFAMKMDLQAVLALAQRMGATIPAAAANIPQSDGSSLTTAVNDNLGLKLESTKGAVTVVVIDSVEAPMPD